MNECYILYSPKANRFYIGATHEGVVARLEKHNLKSYGSTSTSFTSDWEIFLSIPCSSFSQAIKVEKHIKRMKSRVYMQNLKKHPDMIKKLLDKYS